MEYKPNKSVYLYDVADTNGGIGTQAEIINALISKVNTATLVMVKRVYEGGIGDVGFVDVLPLVTQITASGASIPNSNLYKLPYFRLQGGSNAVVIDPQVGDLGLAVFASRDISRVKRTKQESAPTTRRKYNMADGLYIGGFLNGTPTQYIHFLEGGGIKAVSTGVFEIEAEGDINLLSKGNVNIKASGSVSSDSQSFQANATDSAKFTGGGGISADGDISTNKVSSINDHIHSGVKSGSDTTGMPL